VIVVMIAVAIAVILVILVVRVGTILEELAVFLLATRIRAPPGIALLRRELCAAHLAHHLAATGG